MDGLMMDRPLLVKQIAERAEAVFGDREVVARTQDGVERSTYGGSSSARGGWPARSPSSASARATASRPSPGTRCATSSSTSRCRAWARCCTR